MLNFSERNTYNFTDSSQNYLFTTVIECDSTGQLTAKYSRDNNTVFKEKIGSINLECIDYSEYDLHQKIESIVQKHLMEVCKTLRKIKFTSFPTGRPPINLGLTLVDAVKSGIFRTFRQRRLDKVNKFINILNEKTMFNTDLKPNIDIDNIEYIPSARYTNAITDEKGIIRDHEWSIEGALARLLLFKPFSRKPYPHFQTFVKTFFAARKLRLAFIKMVTVDYELYFEGKIVFEQINGKRRIYNPVLFRELCQSPKDKAIWKEALQSTQTRYGYDANGKWAGKLPKVVPQFKINNEFIETAIRKNHVPSNSKKKLMNFIGFPIPEALDKAEIYGNKKRKKEIKEAEIKRLSESDGFLFRSITAMLEGDNSYSYRSEEWTGIKKNYPFLADKIGSENSKNKEYKWVVGPVEPAWEMLKVLEKYLSGNCSVASIGIKKEYLEGLLRIAKMFDLAVSLINCDRPINKLALDLGSYNLRHIIAEMAPHFFSYDVFTKTLSIKEKIKDPSYLTNFDNWTSSRVALHARMFLKYYFEVKSLSERFTDAMSIYGQAIEILSSRGNSGAGKSSALAQIKELLGKNMAAIINPDHIKFFLRVATEIKNHQVHYEGKQIFDRLIDEIEKESFHYIVDLRLKDFADIDKYVLKPAEKRGCTISLSDYDVPLLTTINRILNRDPKGEDPIPSLDAIITGFIEIRKWRTDHLVDFEIKKEVEIVIEKDGKIEKIIGKLIEKEKKVVKSIINEVVNRDIFKKYELYYMVNSSEKSETESFKF